MRIAVLGLGRLGAFHAKVLRELPGVSELRVYDADEARSSTISAELGLAPAASIDAYVETSGGQFVDQLIHDFDVTRWLFADEVDELYATGSTLGFPQYAQFHDVATSAAVLRLRGGAVGLLGAARHNEAGYDVRV